jgi:hypothetical protein
MSIYNGFGTRKLETSYNKSIFNMLYLLQKGVLRALMGETMEDALSFHFSKTYK